MFYDAEEGPHDGNGLKRLLDEMPWLREARLAILLEPTDLKVELGCNGVMNAEVRVPGKSAHSARPWTGVNAVERAAPWLAEVTRFPSTPVTVGGAEFVETLQVTTLHAGRARNVVPDELVANLNYRFPPDRTLEEAERAAARAGAGRVRVHASWTAPPPGRRAATIPRCGEFVDALRRHGGGQAGLDRRRAVHRRRRAGVQLRSRAFPSWRTRSDEYCPIDEPRASRTAGSREFLTRDVTHDRPRRADRAAARAGPLNPLLDGRRRVSVRARSTARAASWCPPGVDADQLQHRRPARAHARRSSARRCATRCPRCRAIPPSPGLPELRAACARLARAPLRRARSIPRRELLPVNGTKEAVFLLALAVVGRDDGARARW